MEFFPHLDKLHTIFVEFKIAKLKNLPDRPINAMSFVED